MLRRRKLSTAQTISQLISVGREANQMINLEPLKCHACGEDLHQSSLGLKKSPMFSPWKVQTKVWCEQRRPLISCNLLISMRIIMVYPKKLQMRKSIRVSHKNILESHYHATQGSYSRSSVWTTHCKAFTCLINRVEAFRRSAIRATPINLCCFNNEMKLKTIPESPRETDQNNRRCKATHCNSWGEYLWSKNTSWCYLRPQFKVKIFELIDKYTSAHISTQ